MKPNNRKTDHNSTVSNRHARLFELIRQKNLTEFSHKLIGNPVPCVQFAPREFLAIAQLSLQSRQRLGNWTGLFARHH